MVTHALRLILCVVGFIVFATGHVYAKPGFGDCGACHGIPTVSSFDLPASHTSLTVPVTVFTGTDTDRQVSSLARVTGYMLTTTATAPPASDVGWKSSPPAAFTFAEAGSQTLYAWVKDAVDNVSTAVSDRVDILTNGAPVADAGSNQTVAEGIRVSLNASNSSDPDDGIAGLRWIQTGGPAVVLSSDTAENPSFTTPDVGPSGASLTFRLTVTDYSGAQDEDTCIVTVSWVNIAPVANAGDDQTLPEVQTVQLDASASRDADDGIASYQWQQTGGATVQLSDAAAVRPTFAPVQVGPQGASLTFRLTVTDNGGLQASDSCVVNLTSENRPPVADAGSDQSVTAGDEVTLDGSGSTDPDQDPITYLWKQTAGAPVVLSDTGAVKPVFTAPALSGSAETLEFLLTIGDQGGLQSTDTCTIRVQSVLPPPPVNMPPTADAGQDQSVTHATLVTLDGSGSTDPEGAIETYLWVQIDGPSVSLSDATAAVPTFTAPSAGSQDTVLTFELTVSDAAGQAATDSCLVSIRAVQPPPGDSPPTGGEDGGGDDEGHEGDDDGDDNGDGSRWSWIKHLLSKYGFDRWKDDRHDRDESKKRLIRYYKIRFDRWDD